MNKPNGENELTNRRYAWAWLSELFLDTEVQINEMAEGLAKSVYTLEELEHILVYEVAPHLYQNLESVAGEWAAFDLVDLENKIIKSRNSKKWNESVYYNKSQYMKIAKHDWKRIKKKLIEIRNSPNQKMN